MRRLSINSAYSLITHIGFGQYRKQAALAQMQCKCCKTNYLVVTEAELDNQNCPMCALDKNYRRLTDLSTQLRQQPAKQA